MIKDAYVTSDGLYRYQLFRGWSYLPILGLIMLNPSTADALKNDPTVFAAITMATRWGFGGLLIGNLFGWRSSDPGRLRLAELEGVAVGSENDYELRTIIRRADQVMVGWGGEGDRYKDRIRQVDHLIRHLGKIPKCIGTTKTGQPKHPLLRFHTAEQKANAALTPWVMP